MRHTTITVEVRDTTFDLIEDFIPDEAALRTDEVSRKHGGEVVVGIVNSSTV